MVAVLLHIGDVDRRIRRFGGRHRRFCQSQSSEQGAEKFDGRWHNGGPKFRAEKYAYSFPFGRGLGLVLRQRVPLKGKISDESTPPDGFLRRDATFHG